MHRWGKLRPMLTPTRASASLGKSIQAAIVMVASLASAVSAARDGGMVVDARPSVNVQDRLYSGTVGGKPITLFLKLGAGREGAGEVSGRYRYGKRQGTLALKGMTNGQGGLTLTETDSVRQVTGTITGRVVGPCLDGSWSAPGGARTLPFKACELTKREVLARAVGSYSLQFVDGNAFANAMIVMEKRRGKWEVGGSAIVGNMRDSVEFALDDSDLAVLDGLGVEVGKDLSVRLRVGDKVVRHIPFKSDGMDYALEKDDAGWAGAGLSPSTTFCDLSLCLSAVHNVDLSATSGSRYFSPEGPLTVSYEPGVDEFLVHMGQLDQLKFRRTKR